MRNDNGMKTESNRNYSESIGIIRNEKAPDARCSRGYGYFWKYTLRGREFSTSPILNVNMKLPSVGN